MAKKILIVDDEQEICELLADGLKTAGYDTIWTTKSEGAVKLAEKEKPHLVILDIHMPHVDGVTVYENLRKSTTHRRTPIIFLTVLAQGVTPKFASLKHDEAHSIIPKPASLQQIENEVERLLRHGVSFKN